MTRLDQALVERGLCESREKAKRAILAGQVRVNAQTARKPSDSVKPDDEIHAGRAGKIRQPRRPQARTRAAPFSTGRGRARSRLTSARPPADSPIACCSTARPRFLPWTSARASSRGNCASDQRVVVMEKTNARHLTAGADFHSRSRPPIWR